MNLFDTDGRMEDVGPGYRMRRLEVYNWGTFDGAVWPFELGGNTSLLTGQVDSGRCHLDAPHPAAENQLQQSR